MKEVSKRRYPLRISLRRERRCVWTEIGPAAIVRDKSHASPGSFSVWRLFNDVLVETAAVIYTIRPPLFK
jgi:hypothetical protein